MDNDFMMVLMTKLFPCCPDSCRKQAAILEGEEEKKLFIALDKL
jgi:hypothetical protein